jgi:hypothetical protein
VGSLFPWHTCHGGGYSAYYNEYFVYEKRECAYFAYYCVYYFTYSAYYCAYSANSFPYCACCLLYYFSSLGHTGIRAAQCHGHEPITASQSLEVRPSLCFSLNTLCMASQSTDNLYKMDNMSHIMMQNMQNLLRNLISFTKLPQLKQHVSPCKSSLCHAQTIYRTPRHAK